MLHSTSSPPLQSLLQRNCSPLKQSSSMNGPNSAQDSYFIFDELSTALPERNNNSESSKIIGNSFSMQSNKSSSVGSSIGGSTNTSTATNLSSTFQRPHYNQQQQRFGFGEFWLQKQISKTINTHPKIIIKVFHSSKTTRAALKL